MKTFYNPKNFKQGQLILNRFNQKDLILFGSLFAVSLLLIVIVISLADGTNPIVFSVAFIMSLLPAGLGFFFTTPFIGYHNAYEFIKLKFTKNKYQKKYMWEGIIYDDEN